MTFSLSILKVPKPAGIIRRNPGRMDGVRWRGRSFVCPENVDGSSGHGDDVYYYNLETDWGGESEYILSPNTNQRLVISLLDIARPAKTKGTRLVTLFLECVN